MNKKTKRIIRRWLALVLITALIGQTVSMRFFDTAYAADTEQIVSEAGTEAVTETNFSQPVTVLGEVESLRTEDEKHFRMSDGTYMAVNYGMPVHAQDEDGEWQDIDNRMVLLTDQTAYHTYNPLNTTEFSTSLNSGNLFETAFDNTLVSISLLDTAQANQMMEEYTVRLETQLETLTEEWSEVLPELQKEIAIGMKELHSTLQAVSEEETLNALAQARLQNKLEKIEEVLSVGSTMLTYDRTAVADTSVIVPTLMNVGTGGNAGDSRVGWTMEDILPDNLQSSVLYEDVFPGVNLLYTKYSYHVKEQIIVKEPQTSYRYDFVLGLNGLEAVQKEDGSIWLVNDADEVLYDIPAPFMQDADGVISRDVEYVLTPTEDSVILSVIADAGWMNDEERAYPVAIDPTIRVSEKTQSRTDIASGYVIEGLPDNAYGGANDLWVGWTQWNSLKESVAYLYFKTLPEIPAGSVVIDALLQMYMLSYSKVGLNSLTIGAYEFAEDLPSNLSPTVSNYSNWITFMTWNTRADHDEENMLDYNIVSSATSGYDVRWEITEAVKKWYAGGTMNRSIALAIDPALDYNNTYCANATFYGWDSTNPPILIVSYRDQIGIEPYYTYRTIDAGHAGTAYIADATGQVKVVKNIASYASATNPFSLNLVYNSDYFQKNASADYQPPNNMGTGESASVAMRLGQGWTLDIIQTIEYEIIDGVAYLCYYDGDGTKHYFRNDTSKDPTGHFYYDEDGLGLKIEEIQIDAFYLTDDHGNSWDFTDGKLTQVNDADGNIYTINYSSNRITSIIQKNKGQSSITVASFAYSGDYVSSITDAAGNVHNFAYSGTILTGVKLGSTQNVSYTYSGNRLISMTDQESAYGIHFSYDTAGRINQYQEKGGSTVGTTVKVSYTDHSKTTYRLPGADNIQGNSDDIYSNYLFDYAGRTVNAYTTDLSNNILGATNAVYTKDQTTSGTDKRNNRIETTGSIGAASPNLIECSGFESTSYGWTFSNASRSTAKPRTGAYSMQASPASTSTVVSATHNYFTLTAGKNYTLSAYVNTTGLTAISGQGIWLKMTDSSGNTFTGSAANNSAVNYVTSADMDGGWVRIHLTFTAATTGTHTAAIYGSGVTGTFYVDDVQLEEGNGPGSMNLLADPDMGRAGSFWSMTGGAYTSNGGWNSSAAIQLTGAPTTATKAVQTVSLKYPASDTYILSGWAKANAVPDNVNADGVAEAQDVQKQFGLRADIYYSDNSHEYHYVPFNADISDWQFASLAIVPKKAGTEGLIVNSITVTLAYENNANKAYFDNISLVREAAQSMRYDNDGNLESVTTMDLDEEVSSYSGGNLMETQTGGNGTFNYTYDSAHRVTSVTNGIITQTMGYDTAGNAISTVLKSNTSSNPLTIKTTAAYTNYGNLLSSVADPFGNLVTYGYSGSLNKMYGLPSTVKDPKGVVTSASYDAYGRTTNTAISGTASVAYAYTTGNLSGITRTNSAGTAQTYSMAYNVFGNPTSISVGSRTLASYTYGSYNGYLSRLTYGNSDYVTYTYDKLGRVIKETYSEGRTVNYTYNNEGQICAIADSVSGTTFYTYDSLGRLISSYHPGTGLRTRYTYDAYNRLTDTYYTVTGWSDAYEEYTYNSSNTDSISDGTLTGMRMVSGGNIALTYDYLQRLTSRNIASKLVEAYTYKAGSGTNTTSTLVNGKKNTLGGTVKSNFTYTYDANGNILTEYNSISGKTVTYTYDNQNQLTKAVHSDGRTETYSYDTVGNIQSFNNGTISRTYTYGNSTWRDLLTAVNGTSITYDTVGNPLSYYNGSSYTMSWIEGRRLSSVTTGGATTTYQYDESGIRTRKTKSDGSYIIYLVADGTVIGEKHYSSGGSVTKHIRYIFDENGTVCGYSTSTNGTSWSHFYFIRNLQGDVLQVFNSSNTIVAEYTYDSWGNILSATGTQASVNPFRYRGYYYDEETGFYCLSSRYYDPEVGRFINADDVSMLGANRDFTSLNLYAYCGNNPISRRDASGHAWETIFDIISLAASVAEVVANPIDPWAWAGLLGDVVDVAVPFVGGLGEAVDAVKTVSRVVDKGDDIIDAAKNMRRAADAADDIKDSTGAYVVLYEQGQHYIGKGGFNRAITSATEHMTETNKVSAIIWAPAPSKETAFVTEYLLQSVYGVGRKVDNTFNKIWSPGKKIFNVLQ